MPTAVVPTAVKTPTSRDANLERLQTGGPADVLDVLVVLVADVLHELPAGPQRVRVLHRERLRVRAGVVDRRHDLELAELRARVALDGAQLRASAGGPRSRTRRDR